MWTSSKTKNQNQKNNRVIKKYPPANINHFYKTLIKLAAQKLINIFIHANSNNKFLYKYIIN